MRDCSDPDCPHRAEAAQLRTLVKGATAVLQQALVDGLVEEGSVEGDDGAFLSAGERRLG